MWPLCVNVFFFVNHRHAGVYTAEEVALITREKLIRLQSLYIDQFKRLQHLLKEKKRRYLHNRKVEHETLGKYDHLVTNKTCFALFTFYFFLVDHPTPFHVNRASQLSAISVFVYVDVREQSADGTWRSVHEGEGEPEEAQSSASLPSSVRRGSPAAPAA